MDISALPPDETDDPAAPGGTGLPDHGSVIDHARIQAIRAAIANGRYRIDPKEIAARMAAQERELPP